MTDTLLAALTDQEIEELHEYEVEMGREEGAAQSESAISELFKRLEKDNRSDDFARAMNDKEYLHELIKEYGL